MILFLGKDTGTRMATEKQVYQWLCSNLKKMGYVGDLNDSKEIAKFLKKSKDHPLYPKAVGHWNAIINMNYKYVKFSNPLDYLKSESNLYSGRKIS